VGEEVRRKHDRLGARLMYGQHWDRPMPSDRAAITANISMAILRHKIAKPDQAKTGERTTRGRGKAS
jgi:hypothetical protein